MNKNDWNKDNWESMTKQQRRQRIHDLIDKYGDSKELEKIRKGTWGKDTTADDYERAMEILKG